jgi:hypothetical protein
MSKELIKLMSRKSTIKISCEHRRCDTDSSGLELPNGRDHYGLWTWKVDKFGKKKWLAEEDLNEEEQKEWKDIVDKVKKEWKNEH